VDAGQSQEPPGESPVLMPAAPPLGGAAQPCEPTQPFEATQEDTQEDTQEYVATQEDMQGSSDMQQLGEEDEAVGDLLAAPAALAPPARGAAGGPMAAFHPVWAGKALGQAEEVWQAQAAASAR
jgi:hypothetical protein